MPKKKEKAEVPQTQQTPQEDIATALETRNVFHRFTESEINGLNEKITELSRKSRDFSEKKKLLDSICKGTEAEITKTIRELDEGGEERSMECPVVIDYAHNTYTIKHPDTGDVLEVRPLTAAEKQRDLFPQEHNVEATEGKDEEEGNCVKLGDEEDDE